MSPGLPLWGGAIMVGAAGVAQGLDLVATLLVTRALGLDLFGALVAARAVTGLLAAVLGFRGWEGVLAFAPRLERDGDYAGARALVSMALLAEGCVAAVGAVVVVVAGWALGGAWLGQAGGVAVLLLAYARHGAGNLIEVHQAAFRLREDYTASALQGVVAPAVRVVGFAVFLHAGTDTLLPFAAVDGGASIIAWALGLTGGVLTGRLPMGIGMRKVMNAHGAEVRRFCAHNWLAGAVKGLSAYGAEFILSIVATFTAVGAFGMARRLAGVVGFVLSPFLYLVTPWVYRAAATGDAAATRRLLGRITLWSLVPILIADGILVGGGERLLALLIGGDTQEAWRPLLVLMAAFSLQFACSWARPAALGLHLSGVVLVSQALAGSALVGGTLLLASYAGASGAALAVLVAYVLDVGVLSTAVLYRLSREAEVTPSLDSWATAVRPK
ncbi:MAG: hypothetical protein KIT14_01220 [bacterium]|nr:hypothetical protein [bacterium]